MDSNPQTDTFERSCRHWSEDGRAGMEAFYRLASIDYRLLAEELDWGKVFQELAQRCGPEIRLLDVACGSGQFPDALLKHGGLKTLQNLSVTYSLLDPSEFSIRTARQRLAAPFESCEEHLCTIQQFEPTASRYAVLWATHALYCVPQCELEVAVDQMLAAVEPAGLGFIAHASQQSHYIRFQDLICRVCSRITQSRSARQNKSSKRYKRKSTRQPSGAGRLTTRERSISKSEKLLNATCSGACSMTRFP